MKIVKRLFFLKTEFYHSSIDNYVEKYPKFLNKIRIADEMEVKKCVKRLAHTINLSKYNQDKLIYAKEFISDFI